MHTKSKIRKREEAILFIVGSLLLILAFLLFHYSTILEVNDQLSTIIQNKIFKETTSKNTYIINVSTDYVEKVQEKEEIEYTPNYIGFLEIDKISLKQGFLPKNNYYNHVDYHIQVLDPADFPDVINGNFILAGHSGNSKVSFFRNLYKLELGDIAKVYYQSKTYKYQVVNIYKEDKDGSIAIYRDTNKTTLTLITCSKDDKLHQTIYILELIGVETY